MLKLLVFPFLFPFLLAGAASAAPASFTAGKSELLCGTAGQQAATWTGACKDGRADGAGVATWTDGATPNRFEGTLALGVVSDSATLVYGATTYIGTFRHFEPHGQGFFKFEDGSMYEGGLDNGKRQGPGIFQDADRSRYEGMWVADRREGQGQATFALGGSYEGHWRAGRFDGAGTVVYVGGRTYTGQFKGGRVAGLPPLAAVEQQRFRINNTTSPVGTYIPAETASSPVSGNPWAAMSEGERQIIRQHYMALEEGDEPPYPVNGMRPVFAALTQVGQVDFSFSGRVRMHVLVGADGQPKSVATIGKVSPEAARFLARVMMITVYKPAVCHGAPCEMLMPLEINFHRKL